MRIIPEWFKTNSSYIIIIFVFYFFSLLLTPLGVFSTWIDSGDHGGYYSITRIDPGDDTRIHSYLRSMVIDGDIDFFNEKGLWNRFELTPTGYSFDFMYAVGSALLWLPFFLAGHIIAHIYSWLGHPVATDGFSFPYLVMTGIGSATYLFMGVILCYELLSNFFSRSVSLMTAMTVGLGSHLPFYAFIRSRMAHANEFFMISLLLYLWFYIRKKCDTPLYCFLFGIVAGLACIVRMDDLPILSFVVVDFVLLFYKKYQLREIETTKKMLKGITVFTLVFLLVFSLPFICAHIIWGNSLALGGISAGGDDVSTPVRFATLIFERSQMNNMWNFFFSEDKGLFLSSPFWFLALIGFWFFGVRERYWGSILLVGLSFPLIWNIIHTSTGLEYGIRRTTSALPFLSFGFAALFDYTRINQWRMKRMLVFLVSSLLIVWQYLQVIQHKILMEYNHPTFITTAFKNVPRILSEMPELLLRSSSWMKFVILKDIQLHSVSDIFFLIVFPLLQLVTIVFSLMLFKIIKANLRHREYSVYPLIKIISVMAGLFFLVLPVFIIVGNPEKTAAEIDERQNLVKEVNKLEQKIGRSVIYLNEDQIYQLIAQSYLEQQQGEKAEGYLEKAVLSNPHNYQTRFKIAVIYHETGRTEKALKMYKEVVAINPDHAAAYKNLGIIYLNVFKDYDRALSAFQRCITLVPDQEQAEEIKSVIERLKNVK